MTAEETNVLEAIQAELHRLAGAVAGDLGRPGVFSMIHDIGASLEKEAAERRAADSRLHGRLDRTDRKVAWLYGAIAGSGMIGGVAGAFLSNLTGGG